MGKYIKYEYIEHSEEDQKDFEMDNERTTIIEIDRMVFSVNHNEADKAAAQEALRDQVANYILLLAEELKKL
jgi:hypothetical protein